MSGDRLAELRADELAAWAEVERHAPLTPERSAAMERWMALAIEREDLEESIAEGIDPAEVPPVDPAAISGAVVWARRRRRDAPGQTRITIDHGAEPATQDGIARVVRRLPGGANRGGRTLELGDRLATYATAIRALHRDGGGWAAGRITVPEVAKIIYRTTGHSQMRADVATVGGWKAFRADVIAGRFTGR